jgi:hypothetical protein
MDSIRAQLFGQRAPAQHRPLVFGSHDDEALELVDCLGTTDKHAMTGSAQGSDGFA